MIKATVTKTGNSYALRVPKRYIDENGLKLGDIVQLEDPLTSQNQAVRALVNHGKKSGPLTGMANPVKWQRSQRLASDPWEDITNDTAR